MSIRNKIKLLLAYKKYKNKHEIIKPRQIKDNISIIPLSNISNTEIDKELELSIRQDLVQRHLLRKFLSSLLVSYAWNCKFTYGLPKQWRNYVSSEVRVSDLHSSVNWFFYSTMRFCYDLFRISILFKCYLKPKKNIIISGSFCHIEGVNLRKNVSDEISPHDDFARWLSLKNNDTFLFNTKVGGSFKYLNKNYRAIKFPEDIVRSNYTFTSLLKNFIISIRKLIQQSNLPLNLKILCFYDYLIKELLPPSIYNPSEVFYVYQGSFKRNLWTYGKKTSLWFYSINNVGPKLRGLTDIGAGHKILSFDIYYTWNHEHSNWLRSFGIPSMSLVHSGPMSLYARDFSKIINENNFIAIFDIHPIKYHQAAEMALINNYYSMNIYSKFLKDTLFSILNNGYRPILFPKKWSPEIIFILKSLLKGSNYSLSDVTIFDKSSSYVASKYSIFNICYPLTSVAHYFPHKSIYYDPLSIIENDCESNPKIIFGPKNLDIFLQQLKS